MATKRNAVMAGLIYQLQVGESQGFAVPAYFWAAMNAKADKTRRGKLMRAAVKRASKEKVRIYPPALSLLKAAVRLRNKTFWDHLGDAVGDVVSSPIFASTLGKVISFIPIVGPAIGPVSEGLAKAAGGLVDAARHGGIKGKNILGAVASAASGIAPAMPSEISNLANQGQALYGQGQQVASAVQTRAKKARKVLAAARVIANPKAARPMVRARQLVLRAKAGNLAAQKQLIAIASRAKAGDVASIKALAYVSAIGQGIVKGQVPEATPTEAERFSEEAEEQDEGAEDEEQDETEGDEVGAVPFVGLGIWVGGVGAVTPQMALAGLKSLAAAPARVVAVRAVPRALPAPAKVAAKAAPVVAKAAPIAAKAAPVVAKAAPIAMKAVAIAPKAPPAPVPAKLVSQTPFKDLSPQLQASALSKALDNASGPQVSTPFSGPPEAFDALKDMGVPSASIAAIAQAAISKPSAVGPLAAALNVPAEAMPLIQQIAPGTPVPVPSIVMPANYVPAPNASSTIGPAPAAPTSAPSGGGGGGSFDAMDVEDFEDEAPEEDETPEEAPEQEDAVSGSLATLYFDPADEQDWDEDDSETYTVQDFTTSDGGYDFDFGDVPEPVTYYAQPRNVPGEYDYGYGSSEDF